MLIIVSQIPASGRLISLSLVEQWVQQACHTAFEGGATQLTGNMNITALGTQACVHCELVVECKVNCSRCMTELSCAVQVNEELLYEPDSLKGDHVTSKKQLDKIKEEIELSAEDLEIGWYVNDRLDLQEVLTEAFILAIPNRMYCGMAGITRLIPGECRKFKGDDEPIVHNPFANLDVL